MAVTRGPEPVLAAGPGVVAGKDTLAKGALSTWDAVAISVSVIAPGMAMLLNVPGVAIVAGGSTPLAFLLGGIGVLALAFVVIGFTRRMASAGYAYTYASRSIGKEGGFVAGWLYAFGFACFVPMTMAGVSGLFIDLLGLDKKYWFLFFLIGMALLVALSIIRIKVTTSVLLLVGAVTIAAILIVDLVVVGKGGHDGNTLQPFTFGHTVSGGFNGVFYGIILGVTSYIGFETAADFGEETANPRRSIPIAIIAATGFAIVFYLLTTYALTVGFGVANGATFGADPFALKTIASTFVGGGFGTLVEIGGMLSAFIVCLACATAVARTLFAMGREGVLPVWFSHTHPRFKTPVNATVAIAVVATAAAAFIGFVYPQDAFGGATTTIYFFYATLGTLAVILVYIGLCFGGMAFFRRTKSSYNIALHGLVPLIGAVIFGAAFYGSVYPQPPFPLNLTPYITGIWLVIGVVAVLVLRSQNPAAVGRIGSILGEEGGEDAKLLGVIDDHAHPFPLAFEPLDLAAFTLDVAEGEEAERTRRTIEPTRLATEALRVRLAAHLGCEVGDVVAVRDQVARADWRAYVRGLFANSDTSGMLMDAGWQGLPPGGAGDFTELSGAQVWELARLEPVIDRHVGEGCGVGEVIDAVDAFMEQTVRDGAVGFKTVLAYRTGLAVDVEVTRSRAERELGSDRAAGLPVRRTGKSLRDLLFLRVLERCADLQRPLQVHTGIGDSEIRLAESDPLLLEEALRTSAATATDVVLIHGSFPWHEQAGYLASVRPRVWTEFSLCNLFSPTTTADRLLRILDVAPAGRITVGSDGHGIPESHWFGSVVVRDAWAELRNRLRGSVRESWLDEVRERLFERNARDLYGLPAPDQQAS